MHRIEPVTIKTAGARPNHYSNYLFATQLDMQSEQDLLIGDHKKKAATQKRTREHSVNLLLSLNLSLPFSIH